MIDVVVDIEQCSTDITLYAELLAGFKIGCAIRVAVAIHGVNAME